MGVIQSYYTLWNRNNGAELMLLYNIGFFYLINKLSLSMMKEYWISYFFSLKVEGGHIDLPGINYF